MQLPAATTPAAANSVGFRAVGVAPIVGRHAPTVVAPPSAAYRILEREMSSSNIAVHDRVVEAVNAREVPDDVLAPGFRMENRASAVTDYTYHGARGFGEWMGDLFESFAEGARYGVEEILAVGDDFVVARFFVLGRGASSGKPLEFRWTGVTWFRGGKATRAIGYTSGPEALAAVGLGG